MGKDENLSLVRKHQKFYSFMKSSALHFPLPKFELLTGNNLLLLYLITFTYLDFGRWSCKFNGDKIIKIKNVKIFIFTFGTEEARRDDGHTPANSALPHRKKKNIFPKETKNRKKRRPSKKTLFILKFLMIIFGPLVKFMGSAFYHFFFFFSIQI